MSLQWVKQVASRAIELGIAKHFAHEEKASGRQRDLGEGKDEVDGSTLDRQSPQWMNSYSLDLLREESS